MLTKLIESDTAAPAERLVLLLEIADDAQRLKMGSEDKIRVAGKACEEVIHSMLFCSPNLIQLTRICYSSFTHASWSTSFCPKSAQSSHISPKR